MSPRRLMVACLALLAGPLLLLGCGSGEERGKVEFSAQNSEDWQNQLDKIQAFYDDQNCDRAIEAIATLRDAIEESDESSEQAEADLNELLDDLEAQIESDCEEEQDTTTSSTEEDTTEDEPETTDTVPTETTTEETTETTTEKEPTTTEEPDPEPTTTTQQPPVEPPGGGPPMTPPGQGGGDPGGGVAPRSGSSDRKADG